jgi:hypothetical protein
MKKYSHIGLKIVLSLILLLPILGLVGIFPEPTADMYNTEAAFSFITALNVAWYISYTMAVVHIIAFAALWTRREAFAAVLILPITVNVVGFHAFLDGGLLTGGAVLGNIMLLINLYLLWKNCETIKLLTKPQTV